MADVRDLAPEDAPALTDLYEDYDWWADREVEDVRRALAESDVAVGVVERGGGRVGGDARQHGERLVAAARVLTDFTYYATVYDVLRSAKRF